VDSVSEALIL